MQIYKSHHDYIFFLFFFRPAPLWLSPGRRTLFSADERIKQLQIHWGVESGVGPLRSPMSSQAQNPAKQKTRNNKSKNHTETENQPSKHTNSEESPDQTAP